MKQFFSNVFDKLVDMMETYNRYKAAALLSNEVKSKEELDKILKDLYK